MRYAMLGAVFFVTIGISTAAGQQRGDPDYQPVVKVPAYKPREGPVVLIDEGHHNFHTRTGRYQAFASLLEADGYRVKSHAGRFTRTSLRGARVLVIANALHESNARQWVLPTPSAFNDAEIENVESFVRSGGSLFLIADHMPFPGAAQKLAARFGVKLGNGFALQEVRGGQVKAGAMMFREDAKGIAPHAITRGRNSSERIRQVVSFTGTAFQVEGAAAPLIVLGESTVLLSPRRAWKFEKDTPRLDVAGWLQGAALKRGKGRVVVFGEAAMFSSQRTGSGGKMGMTSPEARDNERLLLNILRWLSSRPK